LAGAQESEDDEHRYFVAQEPAISEDDEPPVEAPSVEVEISGVRRIQFGAIAGILGIALGALAPIYLLFVLGIGLSTSTATVGSASQTYSLIETLILVLFFGVALLLVSFVLYAAGFAKLRRADPKFTAPLALSVIGLLGFLLLVAVVGLLAGLVLQVVSCGGPGKATAACVTLSAVTIDPILLLVGLAVGVIGWVGIILGVYRVGRRYGSTITRIGAILYAVPVAEIVAPILILIGSRSILRRLRESPEIPTPPPDPSEP
jgi:Protein of unknown function (DUF973)